LTQHERVRLGDGSELSRVDERLDLLPYAALVEPILEDVAEDAERRQPNLSEAEKAAHLPRARRSESNKPSRSE
jgi:hypothetical protein